MCDNNFKEDPIEIPEKDTNKEQDSTQKKPEEKKEYDKDDWKKMFSKKLYDLIGEESVSSIANKIDIEARTLHNYIKEKAVPTAMNLAKIANYFNVSADDLITPEKNEVRPVKELHFDGESMLALAALIKELDVKAELSAGSNEKVVLTVEDKLLAMALSELYLAKGTADFDKTADRLAVSIGSMHPYKGKLVDETTFMAMMRHEFIYRDLEDRIMRFKGEDGSDQIAMDVGTHEEIARRTSMWDNMTPEMRAKWVRSNKRPTDK